MVRSLDKTVSLEEFLKLPETKPASEYINGQIIQKPMPQGKHSKLQGNLVERINQTLEESKIALALPELRCTFGGRSIVPDVAVFTWSRIPLDENGDIANVFTAAPDWTIEILSPDQSLHRVTSNVLHCIKHGAKLGWLIDPDNQGVLIFNENQQIEVFEEPTAILPIPNFAQNIQLTIAQVFGWLKL